MPGVVVANRPGVLLYDANGVVVSVADNVTIPAGTQGVQMHGTDAGTSRRMLVDAAGRQLVSGAAASGAAAAGNPVLVGGSDGTNAQTLVMKAASTAAAAADVSAVVALSPNSLNPLFAQRLTTTVITASGQSAEISAIGCAAVLMYLDASAYSGAAGGGAFEATVDGTNWISLNVINLTPNSGTFTTSWSSSLGTHVIYQAFAAGWTKIRARCSSFPGTGQFNVSFQATTAPAFVYAANTSSFSLQAQIEGQVLSGTITGARPLPMGGRDTGNISRALLADTFGRLVPATAGTATATNVASSATEVTLLAANSVRRGVTIFNDSTQILYVKFGTGVLSTSFTFRMVANAYYEAPFLYSGIITGLWANVNGNARVTELAA